MSKERPLIVDWKGLVRMGWPYSRVHTMRMCEDTIQVSRKVTGQTRPVVKVIPNPDPFPEPRKLGWHPNSHLVWPVAPVLAYFEAHGLAVTQDWLAPA